MPFKSARHDEEHSLPFESLRHDGQSIKVVVIGAGFLVEYVSSGLFGSPTSLHRGVQLHSSFIKLNLFWQALELLIISKFGVASDFLSLH